MNKLKQQVGHKPKEALEHYIENKTFFNIDWSSEKIKEAVNIAHNRARKSGNIPQVKGEYYTTTVFREKINVGYDKGKIGSA